MGIEKIVQCCECKKIRIDNEKNVWDYKSIPDYQKKEVSHTYCPKCYEKTLKEIGDE